MGNIVLLYTVMSSFHSRAENGPCGYKVVPMGENRTLFIWVLNSDLKVLYDNYSMYVCSQVSH